MKYPDNGNSREKALLLTYSLGDTVHSSGGNMATGMEGMDLGAEGWLVTGHPHSGSREKIGSETVL